MGNVTSPGVSAPAAAEKSEGSTPSAKPEGSTPKAGAGGKPASGAQKEYYDKMYDSLLKAAKEKGVKNPEVIAQLGATQTSLETGYGKHMVGNNAFGIKAGKGDASVSAGTQEFVGGRMVGMKQNFKSYKDVTESAGDYVDFLKRNKRYQGVLGADNINDAIAAQAKTGYATDPNYGSKLAGINAKMQGATPSKGAVLAESSKKDMVAERDSKTAVSSNQSPAETKKVPGSDDTGGKFGKNQVGNVEPVDARERFKMLFGMVA